MQHTVTFTSKELKEINLLIVSSRHHWNEEGLAVANNFLGRIREALELELYERENNKKKTKQRLKDK